VTVGGAVANDVHGKNHARAGSFGHHVRALELLRSSGERLECAPGRNEELFRATIGGLGLTGLVTRIELALRRVETACFDAEYLKLARFEEFFRELPETAARFEHAAAWLDGLDRGVRGILGRANRAAPGARRRPPLALTFPCTAPAALLTDASVGLFNRLVWRRQRGAVARRLVHQDAILFPEDRLLRWNRAFGRRGILEYHALFPREEAPDAVGEVFDRVFASRERFYIGVLKAFGDRARAGLLSFARPGVSVAMNFPFRGERTLRLLDELDRVLLRRRGVLYLAKDARMLPAVFRACYPEAAAFARFVDPRFSSGLWRRVTG
jgi:FAD/FMN-containing dehydrogenase